MRPLFGIFLGLGVLGLAGCGGRDSAKSPPARPFAGVTLTVGMVGDGAILPSLKNQRGEWVARTGAELILLDEPLDPAKLPATVDVLVFAGERMGDLVDVGGLSTLEDADILPPVATEDNGVPSAEPATDPLAYKDIVPAYRDQVTRYGKDRVALPLGGSALVVAFHRAGFEGAKAAGMAIEPPRTWAELDALAKLFHGGDWDKDGKPNAGVALAWGADPEGVGDAIFLARAAAVGLHKDQFSFMIDSTTTKARVASPPFVQTLQALAALKAFGPPDAGSLDASKAREAFRKREVMMLIDLAEHSASWGDEKADIGVVRLPGSEKVFDPSRQAWEDANPMNRPSYLPRGGGWLVGVAKATSRREAALDFVKYLAGPEATNRLRSEESLPLLAVRSTQLQQGMVNPRNSPGVEPRPWADAVARTMLAERVAPGLRIPDTTGYLAELTKARVAAMNGRDPLEVLTELARAWDERTASHNRERQTWHHKRSLNGIATASEPPPKK